MTVKKNDKQLADMFSGGADELVFWSFRYFMGRRTIHTVCFANELARAWSMLSHHTQAMIRKELSVAFRRDDEMRATNSAIRELGDDCDREAWQHVFDVSVSK